MATITLPFKPSRAAQAVIAVLSALGAVGAELLKPEYAGVLPEAWANWIASALTIIAAVAGFIRSEEPAIDELDKYAK